MLIKSMISIRKKVSLLCLLLFVVFLSASPLSAGDYFVKLYGEKITLYAEQTPLQDLLQELSNQGVLVNIDPLINPPVSASFYQKSIERVLASILKSYNHSLVWAKKGETAEAPLSLIEIQIFEQGRKNRIQPLKQDHNLAIATADNGRLYVKNSVLVRLNPPVKKEQLQHILSLVGATVSDVFQGSGIVRLRLPDSISPQQASEILSGHDEIGMAEPDYAYPLEGNRKLAVAVDQQKIAGDTESNQNVPIAVLDSGLLAQYASSPFVMGVYDALANKQKSSDSVGHGTQMSLVASGVVDPLGVEKDTVPNNSVLAVRAFDDNGFTSNFTLMRSIDYALSAEAKIVSMSWGSENQSPMLEQVVKYATDNGLIMVAAAGNKPTGKPVYPAAYDDVIGVGALTSDGSVWDQSNYGEFVSLYAPGIALMPVGYNGDSGTYAGTSISTAYIAHRIAQLLAKTPDADRETIITTLKSSK